jgi:hypothetical protein
MIEGDRCSPACLDEHPEVCPGTTIHLAIGQPITVTDTTTGASDKFVGSRSGIGNCGGSDYPGPDLIYAVIPAADGTMTAMLDATYMQSFVRVRPACPSSKSEEIACNYRTSEGATTISFPVTANTTYFVAADSWSDESGGFTLTLSLQ